MDRLVNNIHISYDKNMTKTEATITSRTDALGGICAWDVTTPEGDVVPFQSYRVAKWFIANGCPK